jgi:virulence-associated protein VagC
MRTVSIFKNGKNQAARLRVDTGHEGVGELEICRKGDVITLGPVRPSLAMKAGSICDYPHARHLHLLLHHS